MLKALVLGMGMSGVSASAFLKKAGYSVSIYDDNREVLKTFDGRYAIYESSEKYDIAILSPGIPSDHSIVKKLNEDGVEIIGEMELAGRYIANEKIIAVTGTNGKSTTVSIIADLLKDAGFNVFLCGNIGKPVIDGVFHHYDFFVIEISSFQLETLKSIHPDVSLILNVSPDHLDRYSSYENYLLTKAELAKLTRPDGLLVLNGNDEPLIAACSPVNVEKKYFSITREGEITYRNGSIFIGNDEIKMEDLNITGIHNVENIMASVLGVSRWVNDINTIKTTLTKFRSLPHRTEFVDEFDGVSFYDDSKGTNVGAAEMSLAGFDDGKVVVILGGVDKGGSYEPLRNLAEKKCKGVVLIGQAADIIKPYFEGFSGAVTEADSMSQAVEKAFFLSKNDGIVLLSPACSSFDWYKNYKERGMDFRNRIKELKRSLHG